MRKLLIFVVVAGAVLAMRGLDKTHHILVKEPVEVFSSWPTQNRDDGLTVIGYLNPGEKWSITSARYEKDFAVYEVDLARSRFDMDSGYVYFDSRSFDLKQDD